MAEAINIGIDVDELYGQVEREISMAADEAYGDNGMSLYDAVVLTSKDKETVEGYIQDALAIVMRRLYDIASFTEAAGANDASLGISADDLPDGLSAVIEQEVKRFFVQHAAAEICAARRAILAPQYREREKEALSNIETLVRTRKMPSRTSS